MSRRRRPNTEELEAALSRPPAKAARTAEHLAADSPRSTSTPGAATASSSLSSNTCDVSSTDLKRALSKAANTLKYLREKTSALEACVIPAALSAASRPVLANGAGKSIPSTNRRVLKIVDDADDFSKPADGDLAAPLVAYSQEKGEGHEPYLGEYRPVFAQVVPERSRDDALPLSPEYAVPATMNRYLREYQREGIRWMYEHISEYGGALLCDDMGMGKTPQTICLLAALLKKTGYLRKDTIGPHTTRALARKSDSALACGSVIRPILVLCPKSVVHNWLSELTTWGYFDVTDFTKIPASNREDFIATIENCRKEIVIVSHALATRSTERNAVPAALAAVKWGIVVVDEIHEFRNHAAAGFAALMQYTCDGFVGLTGTPIQNELSDCWSLLRLVYKSEICERSVFNARYVKPMVDSHSSAAAAASSRFRSEMWQPYVLQRTKAAVLHAELPTKKDIVVFCKLSAVQEEVYKRALTLPDFSWASGDSTWETTPGPLWKSLHADGPCAKCKSENGVPSCMILPCLNRLKCIANHLELLKPEPSASYETMREIAAEILGKQASVVGGTDPTNRYEILNSTEFCGKLATLDRILLKELALHNKVLIFSRSVRLLKILDSFLKTRANYRLYTGDSSAQERKNIVEEFNRDSSVSVLLISLKAGGVGLNLTAANVVILFDPDWNPANDDQAQDRVYRIGQTRDVLVYRLVATGTVEEMAYLRQVQKSQMRMYAADNTNVRRVIPQNYVTGIKPMFKYHGEGLRKLMAPKHRGRLSDQSEVGPDPQLSVSMAERSYSGGLKAPVRGKRKAADETSQATLDELAPFDASAAVLAEELLEETQRFGLLDDPTSPVLLGADGTSPASSPAHSAVDDEIQESDSSDIQYDFLQGTQEFDVMAHKAFFEPKGTASQACDESQSLTRHLTKSARTSPSGEGERIGTIPSVSPQVSVPPAESVPKPRVKYFFEDSDSDN